MRVSDLAGHWLFARNFLRHPAMLGSVIPSSRYLVVKVLEPVDWGRARRFVEYGPGVGTITRQVLDRMSDDARLLAVELNPAFAEFMRASFSDPRLEVVNGSAADIDALLAERAWPDADYVISGIPFSTMSAEVRETILERTCTLLAPAGEFLVYQFSDRVRGDLQRVFGRVKSGFEPRNILPARYFHCAPPASG